MRLDHDRHELVCKVVYCGPGLSGKTTNLHHIHVQAPKDAVGDMVSIDTQSERTLHFDLLPLDLGTVKGYACRFEFYTVPGQSYYAATRRLVLEGADGIVFVVDSRRGAMDENIESMNDLNDNLRHHQLPDDIPIVIQYNKQDLPDALKPDQLNPLLNHQSHPWFAASAPTGHGVIETMKKITIMVTSRVAKLESLQGNKQPDTGSIQASKPAAQNAEPQTIAESDIEPESWILTCWHCDTMLEVPHARVGEQYQCGSCKNILMVVNPDQGTTQAPDPTGAQAALPPQSPAGPTTSGQAANGAERSDEESGYQLQQREEPSGASSLSPLVPVPSLTPSSGQAMLPGTFPLPGFTVVAQLDTSLLGHRFRVKEDATGTHYRALVLAHSLLQQPGYQDSLDAHIQMASTLTHTGTLRLIGLRRAGGQAVVLMADAPEYQTLTTLLARRRNLAPPQAMTVIRQLAETLEAGSRTGVLHGWIRPDVVLVNKNGHILLDELGIPKAQHYLLRESIGGSAATEHYLAPEHLLNDSPSDQRTDIFLLGCLLFRMITGQGLITGYTAHEALHKVTASGCKTIRDLSPDISRDLNRFAAQLTAIDRKERPQTMRDLLTASARFGGGARGTRSIHKPPAAKPTNKSARRAVPEQRSVGPGPSAGHGSRSRSHSGRRPSLQRSTGHHSPHERHRSGGSGGATAIILVILTAAVVAAGYMFWQQQDGGFEAFGQRPEREPEETTPFNPRQPPLQQSQTPTTTPPDAAVPTTTDAEAETAVVEADAPPATTVPPAAQPSVTPPTGDPAAAAEELLEAYESRPRDAQRLAAAHRAITELRSVDRAAWARLWPRLTQAVPTGVPMPGSAGGKTSDRPAENDVPSAAEQQIITAIQSQIEQQAFAQAYISADRLQNVERKRSWVQRIGERERAIRNALHTRVWAADNEAEARRILEPAYSVWGTAEGTDWADSLLAAYRQKQEAAENAPPTTAENPIVDASQPAAAPTDQTQTDRSPQGFPMELVRRNMALDQAMRSSDLRTVNRIVEGLPEKDPVADAIRSKAQLWQRRGAILHQALQDRKLRLRVSTPIQPGDLWDVEDADNQHLKIRRPSGGSMNLPWSDVAEDELGPLFTNLADDQAKPIELALASVGHLVLGDPGRARLYLRRAQRAGSQHAADLQTLLALLQDARVLGTIDEAEQALAANDAAGMRDALSRLDKAGLDDSPSLQRTRARLHQQLADLEAGRSASSLPDEIDFTTASDREAFPQRSGSWIIGGGSLTNDGDGSLSRNDLGNARALAIRFSVTTPDNGGLAIDFRGVRVFFDLGRQTVQVDSRDGRIPPQPLTMAANTPYSLHMAYDPSRSSMEVQVNQMEPMRVRPGPLTSRLRLSVDTGAGIAFDSIAIKRRQAGGTVADGGLDIAAQQQVLKTALGLTPFGRAYKDPGSPGIVLAVDPRLGQSGIGVPLRSNVVGAQVSIRGGGSVDQPGTLFVGLGAVGPNGPVGKFHDIALPPTGGADLRLEASWQDGRYTIVFKQPGMSDTIVEGDRPADARHLVIGAKGARATLSAPPEVQRP